MPLDPTETSSSLSFAGGELLPCHCLTDVRVPVVSLSISTPPGSLLLQSLCCFWKIHIWSFRDPNEVIPILLGSSMSLVFNKKNETCHVFVEIIKYKLILDFLEVIISWNLLICWPCKFRVWLLRLWLGSDKFIIIFGCLVEKLKIILA